MNCKEASAEPHAASHWEDGFLSVLGSCGVVSEFQIRCTSLESGTGWSLVVRPS